MAARFLKEDGTELDRRIVSQVWGEFQDIYDRSYKHPKANIELSLLPDIDNALLAVDEKYREDAKRVFDVMLNYVRFHEGDELSKLSMQESMHNLPGGDLHIPGGYKQILDDLRKDIPGSAINFNSEVVNIKWTRPGSDCDLVKLTTKDGRIFEANHVIVTCSLGYLKKHSKMMFDPLLPYTKSNAIDTLGFGTVNKIFLEFEKPILISVDVGIAFAWEDSNEKIDSNNWYKRLFGFDVVFTRPNVMLGWVSGDGARAMEGISDKQIKSQCLALLSKFLNDDTIPEPINFIVSRWGSNPYSLGSYSYHMPGAKPNAMERLAEPVTNQHGVPVLLFAGEATLCEFYGCTHAARDSGIREAERILRISLASKAKL